MAYSRRRASLKRQDRRHLLNGCEALEPRMLLATAPVNDFIWDYNILVRFNDSATPAQQTAALSSVGATPVRKYNDFVKGLMEISLPAGQQNFSGLNSAIATLDNNPIVKYVEKNRVITTEQTFPNDPQFPQQYGYHNNSTSGGIPDADIDAPEAWDITTGSRSVIVAVIDTGVDYTHEDLRANIWRNPLEAPGDGIDNDGNGYIDDIVGIDALNLDTDPMDDVDHGTHVAGTIGAVGNNGIGVTGVNWNVRLMPLKFLGASGGSTAGAIECISYVTAMKFRGENIVVSNNSWGGGAFSNALQDTINAQGQAGVLFVAASGNGGADGLSDDNDVLPAYPASYPSPHIIAVGATDDEDKLTDFSNFGQLTVDIAAPGANILSTVPISIDPAGYGFLDGTSMASPHVAGAVALLASVDPTLTSAELKNAILAGADPVESLNTYLVTGGRLNVFKSLQLLPTGSALGTVYTDVSGNGVIEPGFDTPLPGVTVYADLNKNGALDAGERSTVTDANGNYTLNRLPDPPGGFQLRVVEPPYFAITFPNPTPFYTINFAGIGEVRAGLDFGLWGPPGQISGHKWFDANGNASLDPAHGDGPMQGVFIYVDLNNDGRASVGEPAAVSGADGAYLIREVPVGTWFLREVLQPGQSTSFPGTGSYQFNMTAQGNLTGFDFFNSPAHDYGDAPDSYGTLLASGGPVHGYVQGYGLGSRIDADADGKPTTFAAGDDNTFSDDEDGVVFQNTPSPGRPFNFTVNVRVPAFTPAGSLNAWMDFNRDGDFADAGEKIISGRVLGTGAYPFSVNVPAGAVVGRTYLRFRYGIESNIGSGGRAVKGEVEDHSVFVLGALPVANPDQVSVQQFSTNNPIDVLANDVRSVAGPIRIDPASLSATSRLGGRLVLVTNGTSDPSDDFIRYDAAPAPPGTQKTYTDSFTYSITDGTNIDTATVTITVNRISTPPTAVDDTVTASSSGTTTFFTAMLLGNDIPGTDRGTPYSKVALFNFDTNVRDEGGATIGTMSRNTNGTPSDLTDDRLIFTPSAGAFGKTGQFRYFARNPDLTNPAVSSVANVTVQVHGDNAVDSNDIVKLSIEVRNTASNGDVAATVPTQLVQGQKYWVGIFADDLRAFFQDDTGQQANGALSVYLDLLFDRKYVSPVRVPVTTRNPAGVNIRYGEKYSTGSTGFAGDAGTGGLLDELGVTSGEEVVGAANLPVLYVQFVANQVTPGTGTVVLWRTDPADERNSIDPSFSHDVTVVNRADSTQLQDLLISNIAYFHSRSFRIVAPITTSSATLAPTTTTSTTRTPTAPQEPIYTTSTATKTYSALDAALASMFADEDPYKKK